MPPHWPDPSPCRMPGGGRPRRGGPTLLLAASAAAPNVTPIVPCPATREAVAPALAPSPAAAASALPSAALSDAASALPSAATASFLRASSSALLGNLASALGRAPSELAVKYTDYSLLRAPPPSEAGRFVVCSVAGGPFGEVLPGEELSKVRE